MFTSSRRIVVTVMLALAFAALGNTAMPQTPTYTLKFLPQWLDAAGKPCFMRCRGLNNFGDVVGYAIPTSGAQVPVLYTAATGQWTNMGPIFDTLAVGVNLPILEWQMWAINDLGAIAGRFLALDTDGKKRYHAFRYTPDGRLEVLTLPLTYTAFVYAINTWGDVAVTARSDPSGTYLFLVWKSDGTTVWTGYAARYINDSVQVVAEQSVSGLGGCVVRHTPPSDDNPDFILVIPPPNGVGTSINAAGLNESGDIAGYFYLASGKPNRRAFKYINGTQTLLNLGVLLGGNDSYATGISGSGIVVGYSNYQLNKRTAAEFRSFIYIDALRDLFSVIDPASIPKGMKAKELGYSPSISDNGLIVGTGNVTGSAYSGKMYILTQK